MAKLEHNCDKKGDFYCHSGTSSSSNSSIAFPRWCGDMLDSAALVVPDLRALRRASLALGACNVALVIVGATLLVSGPPVCFRDKKTPMVAVSLAASFKIYFMLLAGRAQSAVAAAIVGSSIEGSSIHVANPLSGHDRRLRYKRWLWWTRCGMVLSMLQFALALYLMCAVIKDFSAGGSSKACLTGQSPEGRGWKHVLLIIFLIVMWLVVIAQCATGSDVLRWRSFYASHDTAWRAHYREVFDHGIRELLCCLGRVKYLSTLEDDDICVVAKLLGDLMAYRASGTGHLEILAGLSLLQKFKQTTFPPEEHIEAPKIYIQESILFHPFAEAAYTGLLLDFGRNPLLFPCVWLSRQSALTPWTRARRPVLEGDNWWRGHAAAFLRYANIPPEALRKGRVHQTKREAAYFVVVLHDLKTVLITVRGTETPEDLITDGLCRECSLTMDDLDGVINADQLSPHVRETVLSSFPHYGHSGIVETARELYAKLEGQPVKKDKSEQETTGFLASLLGVGCECHGYNIRIVGHSLGGTIAALLGIRLYGRFPNLHVYAYGALPCLDSVIADACCQFVTSIVHNDEFSARLSMNSIIRLRSAAMGALSKDYSPNSGKIGKLVWGILNNRKHGRNVEEQSVQTGALQMVSEARPGSDQVHGKYLVHTIRGGVFLFGQAISCLINTPARQISLNAASVYELSSFRTNTISDEGRSTLGSGNILDDSNGGEPNSAINNAKFLGDSSYEGDDKYKPHSPNTSIELSSTPNDDLCTLNLLEQQSPEMYLPGLIIHIVPAKNATSLQKSLLINGKNRSYKAFLANRQDFTELIVTPYMFLDHLPWRCRYAMQRVIETRKRDESTHDLCSTGNAV